MSINTGYTDVWWLERKFAWFPTKVKELYLHPFSMSKTVWFRHYYELVTRETIHEIIRQDRRGPYYERVVGSDEALRSWELKPRTITRFKR